MKLVGAEEEDGWRGRFEASRLDSFHGEGEEVTAKLPAGLDFPGEALIAGDEPRRLALFRVARVSIWERGRKRTTTCTRQEVL